MTPQTLARASLAAQLTAAVSAPGGDAIAGVRGRLRLGESRWFKWGDASLTYRHLAYDRAAINSFRISASAVRPLAVVPILDDRGSR